MSSKLINDSITPIKSFRGVNGNSITLIGKYKTNNNKVIEFELKNHITLSNICFNIPIIILIFFIWTINFNNFLSYFIITLCFLFMFKSLFLSVKHDTLLIVESVGVQIVEKTLPFFESNTFLPWHTIEDVFINEVITGVIIELTLEIWKIKHPIPEHYSWNKR